MIVYHASLVIVSSSKQSIIYGLHFVDDVIWSGSKYLSFCTDVCAQFFTQFS